MACIAEVCLQAIALFSLGFQLALVLSLLYSSMKGSCNCLVPRQEYNLQDLTAIANIYREVEEDALAFCWHWQPMKGLVKQLPGVASTSSTCLFVVRELKLLFFKIVVGSSPLQSSKSDCNCMELVDTAVRVQLRCSNLIFAAE